MNNNYLIHYGVLGMKWGVRRAQEKISGFVSKKKSDEKQLRQKLTAITKRRTGVQSISSDMDRFRYRNQSLTQRASKVAAAGIASMLIGEVISGKISTYSQMDTKQLTTALTKKAVKLAANTAVNVAINDALASSAAKRYTSEGKKVKRGSDPFMTKEDLIASGVKTAAQGVAVASIVMKMNMQQANAKRAQNEAVFNRWGQNILSEKVSNVVWQSPDLTYAVVDKHG